MRPGRVRQQKGTGKKNHGKLCEPSGTFLARSHLAAISGDCDFCAHRRCCGQFRASHVFFWFGKGGCQTSLFPGKYARVQLRKK